MASLELNHVYKVYDNGVKAVNDFTMNVKDKEFIVFVGPSGCGKSTTLRMIAGLEEITAGDIKIDGQVVNDDEPKERDIAMVFQNYALYPHMTVYKNMAFGLKLRHVPKAVIDEKVRAAAKILGLSDYLDRKPKAMSGGQRQRVALGRAIVREPKIFLLDEPLSNLDAKLRASMRSEISKLHKKLKTTFVYVTHDQVEAMTMGTRIVVMKDGFVQQIDSPLNLYKFPVNKFVAGFIGTPQMNFFGGFLKKDKKQLLVNFDEAKCAFTINNDLLPCIDASYLNGDKKVVFGLRSEHISIEKNKYPFKATVYVSNIEELGTNSQIYADFNKEAALSINDSSPTRIIIKAPTGLKLSVGEKITVYLNLEKLQIFDASSEMTVNPRFPAFTRTSGKVSGNNIELFGTKITLPKALKLPSGKVDVSIPTEAMKLGGNISAKVLKIDTAEEFNLCVVKAADEFIFIKLPLEEKLQVGETIKIGIDLKLVEFKSKGKAIKNINLVNKVDASIVKESIVKTHKNKKGKEYSLKENYCVLETLGYPNITNESLGLKLLSLRSKKIISRVVRVHFDPYCVQFAQEGIKCNVTEILDYGTEKFAKVKTENKKEFIVYCDKPVSIGETFIKIDINKTQIFDKEKDIRIA